MTIEKKVWHPQQEKILKRWGEASACYRYMNNQAYLMYKKSSMRYTLPIIIISTVTGTANFAQSTFPIGIRPIVPLAIGSMNIITAIMTTVMQFLKVNELMEGHRSASIQYGKLSRSIRLELALPLELRNMNGIEMVEQCRAEYDRLIEQSPSIPYNVIMSFEREFPNDDTFFKPEIVHIHPIETFAGDEYMREELKKDLWALRSSERSDEPELQRIITLSPRDVQLDTQPL
jgi:hypothetical protein